jgi:hypothetical protein
VPTHDANQTICHRKIAQLAAHDQQVGVAYSFSDLRFGWRHHGNPCSARRAGSWARCKES